MSSNMATVQTAVPVTSSVSATPSAKPTKLDLAFRYNVARKQMQARVVGSAGSALYLIDRSYTGTMPESGQMWHCSVAGLIHRNGETRTEVIAVTPIYRMLRAGEGARTKPNRFMTERTRVEDMLFGNPGHGELKRKAKSQKQRDRAEADRELSKKLGAGTKKK